MEQPQLPAEGGCRCGRLRFRVTAPPIITMACHCTGCQQMSASAYSLSAAIPNDGFEVISGDSVIGGLHGDQSRHHHCDWCKSWVFTRVAMGAGFVNIRPTMLDNARWYVPFMQTYISEALPWADISGIHSFEKFPDMADFGKLLQEYAAQT